MMNKPNTKEEAGYVRQGSQDEDVKEISQLGVDGKYQWPVRIGSFLLFAVTVAVNYIVGLETGRVSDKYRLYVTPPGLFFTIWAVIYTAMAVVNIINLVKNEWKLPAHIYLAITNVLLIVWICVFNVGNDAAVYFCALFLIILVFAGLKFWIELGKQDNYNWRVYVARNAYAFYLGWIIAAANINFGMVLVFWWGVSYKAQLAIFWVVAPLCAIGVTLLNIKR